MTALKHLCFASFSAVLAFIGSFALTGCGDGGGDGGSGSGGAESGGNSSTGGGSTGGQDASGGVSSGGGSATGGTAGNGGGTSTGGGGGGSLFGDPCTEDTECPMRGEFAGNCKLNWPDGYCSAGCSFFGDCGSGNVCDMGLGTCLKACETDDDCRDGYECSDEYKGCEPKL